MGVLNRAVSYTYNALNQRIQTTFEDGTAQTTLYDELGRCVREVDQAGVTNRFGFDGLGRLACGMATDKTEITGEDGPSAQRKGVRGFSRRFLFSRTRMVSLSWVPV